MAIDKYQNDKSYQCIDLDSIVVSVTGQCNIYCSYCQNRPAMERFKTNIIPDRLLFKIFSELAESFSAKRITITYTGGEPLLAGKEFYSEVLKAQTKYFPKDTEILNIIQTNGTLIDASWAAFFKENSIFVSLSIDGPEDIQNIHRPYMNGKGTFIDVMRAIELLRTNGNHYGLICVVSEISAIHAARIVEFLLSLEPDIIAFLPCVQFGPVLKPATFGDFNMLAFDAWIDPRINPKSIPIRTFRDIWLKVAGIPTETECGFVGRCPSHPNIDVEGNVRICDQFLGVHEGILGNINEHSLIEIFNNEKTTDILRYSNDIPSECRRCRYLSLCGGGCVFSRVSNNGMEYFCIGRKRMFEHIIETYSRMLGVDWNPISIKITNGGETDGHSKKVGN